MARAAQARRCSLSFGRRRSTQAFFFCARCLMVVVGPYPAKGRCAAETSLCFGARPLCDVPAAASNFKPAPRCSCGARAWTLAVSGDEAQHSSLLCVRAVPRSFWSVRILPKNAALARRPLLLSERARYGVSAAASSAKPAPCLPHGAGAQALAVSGKEAQHSTLLRARLAALVLVGAFSTKERCPDEMLLSFGARP